MPTPSNERSQHTEGGGAIGRSCASHAKSLTSCKPEEEQQEQSWDRGSWAWASQRRAENAFWR